jgi:hypothetical protein
MNFFLLKSVFYCSQRTSTIGIIGLLLVFSFQFVNARQKTINPNRYIGSKKQDKILKTEFWNPAFEIADLTVDSVVRYVDTVNDRISVAYVSVNKWLRSSGPIAIKIPVSNTENLVRSKDGQLIVIACNEPGYFNNLFVGRNIVAISKVKGDYSLVSFISIPANNQNPSSKYDRITFSKYNNYGNLVKDITWPSEEELMRYLNSKLGKGKRK